MECVVSCCIKVYFTALETVSLFENRVLRIFGPKRDELTEGWRKLHSEELYNLYSSPSVIRIIKSLRMRWAGYIA
jgi:hypothetical protein